MRTFQQVIDEMSPAEVRRRTVKFRAERARRKRAVPTELMKCVDGPYAGQKLRVSKTLPSTMEFSVQGVTGRYTRAKREYNNYLVFLRTI